MGDLYYPVAKGRDGCRTPMPWDADAPNLGFTTGTPWLPLGAGAQAARRVASRTATRTRRSNFARDFLHARKASAALRLGAIEVLDAPAPILAFARVHDGERVLCVFNMSGEETTHDGRRSRRMGSR